MRIRPCFYLRNWMISDKEALIKISELGYPVWLHGEDLQTCHQATEIIDIFSKGQLEILSYEVEEGLDHLSLAFQACAKKEVTHLIYVDDFSENLVNELLYAPEKIKDNPWSLICWFIGNEQELETSDWMQRALDLGEKDYRQLETTVCAYPVMLVQNVKLKKNSSNNQLRILFSLLRRHEDVIGVAVKAKSLDRPKGLFERLERAHFRFCLLALSSLHNTENPKHSALSFALGVFIACTPFYGVQSFLIFVSCFVFRLNFVVAFIGSQVSLPPIYSLLVPLQLFIGFKLTGKPFRFEGEWFELAQEHFTAWLVGSLLVGGTLAFILGGGWYLIQAKAKKKKTMNWSGKMRGGRFGNKFLIQILKLFGLKTGYFLLYFIVPYFYLFAPKARRGLNEYWIIQKPQMGYLKRQWQVLKHLNTFAQTLLDQVYQAHHEDLVFNFQYSDAKGLTQPDQDKASILLFSHFGGWGVTTFGFGRRFKKSKINVIRYQSQDLSLEKLVPSKKNTNMQALYIRPGEPLFMQLHGVLSGKEALALMGDRPFDTNIELKCFMKKLVPVSTTPFRVAKTYNASLHIVFGQKDSNRTYTIGSSSLDMSELTVDEAIEKYLIILEEQIKAKPHQWFNLYSYWSSLPTLPNGQMCLPKKYELV